MLHRDSSHSSYLGSNFALKYTRNRHFNNKVSANKSLHLLQFVGSTMVTVALRAPCTIIKIETVLHYYIFVIT